MKNILITICARGGSKGIPGKNIKPINGKPLIGYTIEIAQKFASKYSADIGLSTDSDEIKKVAETFGLKTTYTRSSELSSDSAGKLETIKDLLLFEENSKQKTYDYILDLDVTSPLRSMEDLELALSELQSNDEALNIFSVSPAHKNPYFNMVEKKENGFYNVVKSSESFLSRQSAPQVYEMNASFYIYKRTYFSKDIKTAISEKSLIYTMNHMCFDLDEKSDFLFMEYLITQNLLDFDL